MTFKKYPKVHRLGKEEVDGILEGLCHIQEKIDGANTSIWLDKNEIKCGSRNRELSEGFNGFTEFAKSDERIKNILTEHPTWRLYGEWLVRHTVSYKETAYKKWYLFDITEIKDGEEVENFFDTESVDKFAEQYGLDRPHYFGAYMNPTVELLEGFLGTSTIGEKGEGIVIKNPEFRDMFDNHNYGKMVTEQFKEDNGITFGGNNKHADTYWEMYVVNKYITLGRVQKILSKIQSEVEERLDMKHIPRIISTCYHDMITEEIWEIQKKVHTLNFKSLQRIASKKAKQIFVDILNDSISIADKHE